MPPVALADFLAANHDELIRRCREEVARRSAPPPTEAENHRGVPLFLNQLVEELRGGSESHDIRKSAIEHGRDLLLRGLTVEQMVHDYGDVRHSVTDLAMATNAAISPDDFVR